MIYILHWTHNAVTETCIRSLLGQGEIIVIDNGSPIPFATKMPVKVMRLEENLFMIAAFNVAMQMFPSDWYACLNNDTIASDGMIEKLLDALANPDIGIVAPGSSDQQAGILHVPYPSDWPTVFTAHVDNHAWMFTQDVVETIGYPDAEGHTHRACWYANRLYCWKARKAGYKVAAVRGAYIQHLHEGGFDPVADAAGREWIEKRLGEKVGEAL